MVTFLDVATGRGNVIVATHDETGATVHLISRTVYDAAGQAVVTTDQFVEGTTGAIGGTRTTYDRAGRAVKTERLLGVKVGISGGESFVQSFGTVVSANTTQYDDAGRVNLSVDNYGSESRTTHNDYGEVVQTATQSRDENGSLVWLISRTVYDEVGRVKWSTDRFVGTGASPENVSGVATPATRTVYDTQGRAVATVCYEGVEIDVASGNTTVSDEGTEVYRTETIYDEARGRVQTTIGVHAPGDDGPETDYEYDTLGRQIATLGPALPVDSIDIGSLTLPGGTTHVRHRAETHYDTTTGRVDYTTQNILVAVDADGDVLATLHDNRQVTLNTYDAEGRTVKVTQNGYQGGSLELYVSSQTVYDDLGRVLAESDPYDEDALNVIWDDAAYTFKDGTTIVPTKVNDYDDDGRLTAVILAQVENPSSTIGLVHPRYEYSYDERGNLLTIRDNVYQTTADPDTTQIFYDHDGTAGDFSQAYDTRVTKFTYDENGRQTSRTLPLGVATPSIDTDFVEQKVFNDRSLAEATTLGTGNEAPASSVALGQVEYEVSFEGVVTAYRYDNSQGSGGRLVGKYYYDGTSAVSNYQADAADGSLTASDESVTYQYDARGRQITVTQDLTAGTRVTENVYDNFGRLITVKADVDGDVDLDQQLNYEYHPVNGQVKRTYTDGRTLDVADLRSGIAARDASTVTGYIMYSEESIHTRFAANSPLAEHSDHFVAITYESGAWYYDLNDQQYLLTPAAGDLLVADVDFDTDTVTSTEGLAGRVNGIEYGYQAGNLTFKTRYASPLNTSDRRKPPPSSAMGIYSPVFLAREVSSEQCDEAGRRDWAVRPSESAVTTPFLHVWKARRVKNPTLGTYRDRQAARPWVKNAPSLIELFHRSVT